MCATERVSRLPVASATCGHQATCGLWVFWLWRAPSCATSTQGFDRRVHHRTAVMRPADERTGVVSIHPPICLRHLGYTAAVARNMQTLESGNAIQSARAPLSGVFETGVRRKPAKPRRHKICERPPDISRHVLEPAQDSLLLSLYLSLIILYGRCLYLPLHTLLSHLFLRMSTWLSDLWNLQNLGSAPSWRA